MMDETSIHAHRRENPKFYKIIDVYIENHTKPVNSCILKLYELNT
jgi:hypothetical protein